MTGCHRSIRRHQGRGGERGAAGLLSITLVFVSLVSLALAVELARLGATWVRVTDAAAVGAQAGATQVDRDGVYSGEISLDPAGAVAASAAAARAATALVVEVAVAATTETVCVTAKATVRPTLLGAMAGPIEVAATSCARPAAG